MSKRKMRYVSVQGSGTLTFTPRLIKNRDGKLWVEQTTIPVEITAFGSKGYMKSVVVENRVGSVMTIKVEYVVSFSEKVPEEEVITNPTER